jgi:hypothetical protein
MSISQLDVTAPERTRAFPSPSFARGKEAGALQLLLTEEFLKTLFVTPASAAPPSARKW